MKTITKYVLAVPAGKINPVTQTRAKRTMTEALEVSPTDDGRMCVKCEGCWPPEGFHISVEHWIEQWMPFVHPAA